MARAQFRKVHSKNGSGRFVVSEGVAPNERVYASTALPTLYTDIEDDRFEIVLTKGTIVTLVADDNGDPVVVPANGTSSAKTHDDGEATPDEVEVPAYAAVMGCTMYDAYRPFDKGTSQQVAIITTGYVEWPIVDGLNDDVAIGDLISSDELGRPVVISKSNAASHPQTVVGRVWAVEKFATNFDDGLLSYMQLPSDPGPLREVYALTKEGDYKGKLGIRANLDVANVLGAFRVKIAL